LDGGDDVTNQSIASIKGGIIKDADDVGNVVFIN
jgi:hypothetical protein